MFLYNEHNMHTSFIYLFSYLTEDMIFIKYKRVKLDLVDYEKIITNFKGMYFGICIIFVQGQVHQIESLFLFKFCLSMIYLT